MGLQQNLVKISLISLVSLTLITSIYNLYQLSKVQNMLKSGFGPQVSEKAPKKPSEYKFGVKYEKAVEAEKPIALLFYADWCRFCIRFMPKYEKLYKQYKKKYNFAKINVEDPQYADIVKEYQIDGFPTLYLVNPKSDERLHVENQDFESNDKMKEIFDDFYNKSSDKEN